jgi:hypothetical protein
MIMAVRVASDQRTADQVGPPHADQLGKIITYALWASLAASSTTRAWLAAVLG